MDGGATDTVQAARVRPGGRVSRAWGRVAGWAACVGALLLLALALLMGVEAQAAATLSVRDASVALAAVPGRPAAGYFTLSGGDATLVSVASPLASRIELHSSSMAGGVMRMDALPAATVRADAPLRFAPGGNHLMIFGLRGDLKPGATVPLVLRFKDGRSLRVEARAVAPGTALPMHGSH